MEMEHKFSNIYIYIIIENYFIVIRSDKINRFISINTRTKKRREFRRKNLKRIISSKYNPFP